MAGLHPVVVITGATGAIGSATASLLARRGARLLLLGRVSDRLDTMVERLDRDNRVSSVEVDLSSLASVRLAARQISRTVAHVDALLNVAAVFTSEYQQTDDGFELMLATNHLGPFLLTNLLRDRLSGAGRVVTVTAPSSTRVDVDQLVSGLVRSELMREAPRPIRLLTRIVSGSPARAAEDLAELAISPAFQSTTGWLFKGTRRIDPPKSTLDLEAQHSLWKRTAELVELDTLSF